MDKMPEHLIPRDKSRKLEGQLLRIVPELSQGPNRVAISDGELTAIYAKIEPIPEDRETGFVEALNRDPVRIMRHYTEAGWDCVANYVALTDGKRKAIFVRSSPWPS
jgi:hypothetical protein